MTSISDSSPSPEQSPRELAEIIIRRSGFTIKPNSVQELGSLISSKTGGAGSDQPFELDLGRTVRIVFMSGSDHIYNNKLYEIRGISILKTKSGQIRITALKDLEGKSIEFPFEEIAPKLTMPPVPAADDFDELELMPPEEVTKPTLTIYRTEVPEQRSFYPVDPKSHDFSIELSLRTLITEEIKSTKDPILKEVLVKIRKQSILDSSNPQNPNSCFEMKSFSEAVSDKNPAKNESRGALLNLCAKWSNSAFGGAFFSRWLFPEYYRNVANIYLYISNLNNIK